MPPGQGACVDFATYQRSRYTHGPWFQVIYINGAELSRLNLPYLTAITAATPALNWGPGKWVTVAASGGWLQPGLNSIAVEVHQRYNSSNTYTTFDLSLQAQREATRCTPAPL